MALKRALLAVCVSLVGCYTEVEPIVCFSDGEVEGAATSLCCDRDDGSEGFVSCRTLLRDEPALSAVAELAVCLPDGRCAVDCQPGQNCACTRSGECEGTCTDAGGQPTGCGCTTIVGAPGACVRQGLQAAARCAICRECRASIDCAASANGRLCLQEAFCGCETDADCPTGACADGVCGGLE